MSFKGRKMKQEDKLGHWIDRGLWALICAVAVYASNRLDRVTASIDELNVKLSVYIAKSDVQTITIQDHESRIRKLEERKK